MTDCSLIATPSTCWPAERSGVMRSGVMRRLKPGLVSPLTDVSFRPRSLRGDELHGGTGKKEKVAASPGGGHLILPFGALLPWPPGGSRPSPPVRFPPPRSHGHRLTLLFTARACLTAAPEMGNIAHLARLLGAVMPQRPVLWQTINVPREKQRESD